MARQALAAAAVFAAIGLHGTAQAQSLIDRLYNEAKAAAERRAREALRQQPAASPPQTRQPDTAATTSTSTTAGGTFGPSATVKVVAVPQNLWLNVGRGVKFSPPEGKAQIIATNPYIAPANFVFGTVTAMDCLPDGGLLVSGEGFQGGDVNSMGWWRIAADGAVTPFATKEWNSNVNLPPRWNFRVARDGAIVTASRYALYRFRDGVSTRIAGPATETYGNSDGRGSAAGFKNPSALAEDDAGNIWVADQEGCTLRRVTPDGAVTTVIGADRTICASTAAPGDRIVLSNLAWDSAHGELVSAGSTIVARPTHDMHITIWRIKPDGTARRVYYTLKNGRSPVGQNTDHIWAAAVDTAGRIHVATRMMSGRARRQIMRLDEATARLVPLTGQALTADDMRPGHEEAPYDGPAPRANYREVKTMCFGPDRTLFSLDEHLVRRLNADGTVRTWAY